MSSRDRADRRRWRWWSVLLLCGLLLALFAAVAAIGASQAARGERVLGVFAPVADALRGPGCRAGMWLMARGPLVGWAVTAAAGTVAALGLLVGGWRGFPVLLLAAAVSLVTWGQVYLFGDRVAEAGWFYLAGIACAAALGARCPLRSLPGIPRPADAVDDGTASSGRRWHWGWEALLVLGLSCVGLIVRVYALTELPYHFETEMIGQMLMSRTAWSVRTFFHSAFLGLSGGIAHLLPGPLLLGLLGTSVYSIRLLSALFGFIAIPLMYWLGRRLAGFGGAVTAAALLIVAPDQLFWSRAETGGFAPVAVHALITIHLALWLARRFSLGALVAMVLWMPVSRYVYAPCWVLLAVPGLLYAHAVVFTRGAWRKAWYVVPLLAGGVALWIVSLSVLQSLATGEPYRFVHPAMLFGAPAWRRVNEPAFQDAGVLDLIRLQLLGMIAKMGTVVGGLWHGDREMFSVWFWRGCLADGHLTVLNGSVAALFALGLGYLAGQVQSRRAFLLLAWPALGLLPALMSDEAAPRRLSLLLPAVCVIGAVFVAAAAAIVRANGGRRLAAVTTGLLGFGVAAACATSLASHFDMRTGESWVPHFIRSTRPLFERGDLIVHNLDRRIYPIVFGNLDRFLAAPPCVTEIGDDWMRTAVQPTCDFNGLLYELTIPPERRRALRETYMPPRISFLLQERPESRVSVDLLRRLYPGARVRHDRFADAEAGILTMTTLTVEMSEVAALRLPSVVAGRGVGTPESLGGAVLAGMTVPVRAATADDPVGERGLSMAGGLLVESTGWYNFRVEESCPGATLTIDDRPFPAPIPQPMREGVHRVAIVVPDASVCRLPLGLAVQNETSASMVPVEPRRLVGAKILPLAPAPAVAVFPGYGNARVLAEWTQGNGLDFDVGTDGTFTILVLEPSGFRIRRFGRDGTEATGWDPDAPTNVTRYRLANDAAGRSYLAVDAEMFLHDAAGRRIGAWRNPWGALPADLALVPGGPLALLAMPDRDSIAVFTPEGALQGEVREFDGGPGHLSRPAGITVGPDGAMMVIQLDGRALLFRLGPDPLRPEFVREFEAVSGGEGLLPWGAGFDGPDRVVIPDRVNRTPMVYDLLGARLMAASPERDLMRMIGGPVLRVRSDRDAVYLLTDKRLWRVER